MAAGKDWDRLAEATRERRTELGMTQEDVRAAGGPSTATMRLIEGALQEDYHPATLARLEKVLQWQRGSVARLLGGGDPVPVIGSTPAPEGIGPAPVLDRTGESFLRSRDMAARSAPHLDEIEARLAVWARSAARERGESALGEIPDGATVFPDRPLDAERWDRLIAAGFLGEPYTLLQLAQGIAIARVHDEDRRQGQGRGDVAAGLGCPPSARV